MKQFFLAVMILSGTNIFAQQSMSLYRLQADKPKKITAYGALSAQYSKFDGKSAAFSGVYGGVMLQHKLMIGAGGYVLTSRHTGFGINADTHKQNYWKMGYGGLMLEYTIMGNKNIHFTTNALLGGGIIKNGRGRGTIPQNGSDELKDIDASGFYVVQPGINAEIIAASWLRIAGGVGYRYIWGSDQRGISNNAMSAPTASLSFKLGLF